jgi:hypothetical protein
MKLPRRNFLHLAAGAAALPTFSRMARAQAYPSRPVRLRARGERPRSRAAEERYELAPFHCLMPTVPPTERIAHRQYGRRLLRCGDVIRSPRRRGRATWAAA